MQNNKFQRIAKNAGLLYFRMLITMFITLYTSRVVLQALGVKDYGIYDVVAGFVTMLGFLQGAMSSATQRFIAYELGKSESSNLHGIFNMSLNIHILIAFIVLLLGETLGLWFLTNHMTIPPDRLSAAKWVFHFSLVSFMVTIISVPYNALIIAHEQMGVFAMVSILDVILKLLVVFTLNWFTVDKLALYSTLNLTVILIIFITYKLYCNRKYSNSHFRLYWDQNLFRVMTSYTGWNLWGSFAAISSGQGINILLNIFFGPSVNAARAISMQVSAALNKFVQSIQVAINPQIIKAYANDNITYMHRLVNYGAKYNLLILIFLSIPLLYNTEIILKIWLVTIPEFSTIFVQIMIVNVIIDSVSAPLITSAQATGKIKLYQSLVGGILLLNLPISYLLLNNGAKPESILIVGIIISLIALLARLLLLKKLISISILNFIINVIGKGAMVSLIVIITNFIIDEVVPYSLNYLMSTLILLVTCFIAIILVGLSKDEKIFIGTKLSIILRKLNGN